jgi:peptidyl-prolyl cis-trans isomerase SurA
MENHIMFRRFVVLVSAALFCAAPSAFAADIKVVEEIAAKVNGDIITKGDLDDQKKILERTLREEQHLTGPALAAAVREQEKDILANQISQRLLVQRAKDLQISVDADVNRQLAQMQVEYKIPDTEKFHDFIHQQLGMTFEDYKQQLTETLLTRRVIGGEVGSKVNIPESELRKYYDDHQSEFVRKSEVYLSQILISTEGKNAEQVATAEKKAKELVTRANKGEKFSELASENSDDTATAHDGGVLPAIQPDQLREDLRQVIAKTRKGQVTDPIKTPQGFLILKVNERFEEGLAPFDEVKDRIHEFLAGPRMQPKLVEYLNRLRQEAYLEIKEGYVDTAAAPGKDTRWHEVAEIKAQTVTKKEVMATRSRKKALFLLPAGKKPVRPPIDAQASAASEQKTAAPAAAPAKTKPPKVKKTRIDKIRAKAAKAEKVKAKKETKAQKAKTEKVKEQKGSGKKLKPKVEKAVTARPTHGRIKPGQALPDDAKPDDAKPAEPKPGATNPEKPAFDKPVSNKDKPASDTPAPTPAPIKP